jgi:small-conductance mechanosensitive channel
VNKRGQLRASDEDRDRIVEQLHRAATEGRISPEELEQRTSAALKARTYAELEATVSDLPRPSRSRGAPVRRSTAGWALSTVRQHPVLLVVAIPVLALATAMLLAATIVWTVLVLIVLMVGGRHRLGRPPWTYSRYRFGPPRGRPRGYWL